MFRNFLHTTTLFLKASLFQNLCASMLERRVPLYNVSPQRPREHRRIASLFETLLAPHGSLAGYPPTTYHICLLFYSKPSDNPLVKGLTCELSGFPLQSQRSCHQVYYNTITTEYSSLDLISPSKRTILTLIHRFQPFHIINKHEIENTNEPRSPSSPHILMMIYGVHVQSTLRYSQPISHASYRKSLLEM